jgi:hypothetical protein
MKHSKDYFAEQGLPEAVEPSCPIVRSLAGPRAIVAFKRLSSRAGAAIVAGCIWLSALGLVGCDGSSTGQVALADFPSRFSDVFCRRLFRCCTVAQVQRLYGAVFVDENTCRDKFGALLQFSVSAEIPAAEAARRAHYNGATVATCLAKLDGAACTPRSNDFLNIPECAGFIEPLVAAGGACNADDQCHSGFCDRTPGGSNDGACAQVPAKGMSCVSRCAAGSYCNGVSICADPLADGQSCDTNVACSNGNCAGATLLTAGTCAAAPAIMCGPTP